MVKHLFWIIIGLCSGACSNSSNGVSSASGGNANSSSISNFTTVKLSSCDPAKTGVLALDASAQPSRVLDLTAIGSMECISWNIEPQLLHLELANMAQVCASSYSVQLASISNGIAINLIGNCEGNNCIDRCSRSFVMDIGISAPPSEIDVSATQCATDPPSISSRVLLAQSSGSACRYYWFSSIPAPTPVRGSCGTKGISTAPPCPAGTLCGADGDAGVSAGEFCQAQCATDSDCLVVESCVTGLCQLSPDSTWTGTFPP